MKMDTFKEKWKEYKLVFERGGERNLNDVFMVCLGNYKGGLLFDVGGEQGAPVYILKTDSKNNCYGLDVHIDEWIKMGKLKKI